ncbi:uncharacterized protein LOC143218426 isoform X2 [Lasioglossum baleicum]|uniref:uncharacterized protein LOC143218426 isoform X2 n=1 Tax=Lasioglossum baleicum TaxID=434251 RepID=UPI003FCEDC9D
MIVQRQGQGKRIAVRSGVEETQLGKRKIKAMNGSDDESDSVLPPPSASNRLNEVRAAAGL